MPRCKSSLLLVTLILMTSTVYAGTKVFFDPSGVMQIDGKPIFPISVAVSPPPGGKTPWGTEAFAELHDGGCSFMRVTMHKREDEWPKGKPRWTPEGFAEMQANLDALAKNHMYGWFYLYDLGNIKPTSAEQEETLRKVIQTFKDHPALAAWKGADEPAWGKVKPENVIHTYQLIKAIDPDHPVMVLHAAKGEWQSLLPYMPGTDITGMDIFPIGYPPGRVFDLPNRDISVVGDYTQWIHRAAGNKPFWMTLQVAWSGVSRTDNTLRFPTFPQERFMTYEAIIFGARGVNYFGGGIESTLSTRDLPLGYNWTFWQRVLRPVLEEINDKSALYPALLAPDSPVKLQTSQLLSIAPGFSDKPPPKIPPSQPTYPATKGLDFCIREVGESIYIIAAKREGDTLLARFSGLPAVQPEADVLYESPRKIKIKDGSFDDWFGPDEVHIYRLTKQSEHNAN